MLRGFPLLLLSLATASAGAFRYAEDQAPAIVNAATRHATHESARDTITEGTICRFANATMNDRR